MLASPRRSALNARPIFVFAIEPCDRVALQASSSVHLRARRRRRTTGTITAPITTTSIDWRKPWRCSAASSSPSSSSSSSSSSSPSPPPPRPFIVRPATPEDRWHLSQVHCASFFPGLPGILEPLYRLDRVIGLEAGEAGEARGSGRFACLVASLSDSNSSSEAPNHLSEGGGGGGGEEDANSSSPSPLSSMLPGPLRGCFEPLERGALRNGIVGSICVDAQGCQLPARKLPPPSPSSRNAAVTTFLSFVSPNSSSDSPSPPPPPPRNPPSPVASTARAPAGAVAYLSNLAVAPSARGIGVARALLSAAEREAWGWGCRSVSLHVSPGNAPAVALYRGAGFRAAGGAPLPPPPSVAGGAGVSSSSSSSQPPTLTGGPLTLMLKVAPREIVARRAAEAAAAAAAASAAAPAVASTAAAATLPATT